MNRLIYILIIILLIFGGSFWYLTSNKPKDSSNQNNVYPEDIPKNCNSNSLPKFTHNITSISQVTRVIPPAIINERGELKTHSFIHNSQGTSVPVYAPTHGMIKWGTHVTQQNIEGEFDEGLGDEYAIFMELDCNYYIMFDHITNPNEAIKRALPKDSTNNTKSSQLIPPLVVSAGELLGQTKGTYPGGIWDFGLYDRRKKNIFPLSVDGVYRRDEQGVCAYDFFSDDLRKDYVALFDKSYGNQKRVLELCK